MSASRKSLPVDVASWATLVPALNRTVSARHTTPARACRSTAVSTPEGALLPVVRNLEAQDASRFGSFTLALADREREHKEGDHVDTTSLAQSVVDETTVVVDNIAPDQLGNPTPCAEWTVRDVLNHITNGAVMFAMSCDQGSVSEELTAQIAAGDDFKG